MGIWYLPCGICRRPGVALVTAIHSLSHRRAYNWPRDAYVSGLVCCYLGRRSSVRVFPTSLTTTVAMADCDRVSYTSDSALDTFASVQPACCRGVYSGLCDRDETCNAARETSSESHSKPVIGCTGSARLTGLLSCPGDDMRGTKSAMSLLDDWTGAANFNCVLLVQNRLLEFAVS